MLPANVPANTEPFLVGEFLVLPERNELRQLDATTGRPRPEAIRLTAKQMDVLVALASRPGQPVSKNELFEAVWPGVVVGEDNITSCIYELRKAFGEGEYIKTVRQRGYLLTPSVTRPLPQRLLDELDPERPASAEILLSEANGDPAPAAPSPPAPERAGVNDRWGRRQLVIWLGALAFVVAAALFWLNERDGFKVGFEGFANATSKTEFDQLSNELDRRFLTYFKDKERPTLYWVSDFSLFAATTVHCTINLSPNDRILLTANISGETKEIRVIGPRDDIQDLGTLLFDGIRRVLDSRACNMDSEVDLLKAGHCLNAGARLLKKRSTLEALDPLLKAEKYYSALARLGSRPAAEQLLVTYDHLANLYDIDGNRKPALDQIDKALAAHKAFHLPADNEGLLLILRRQAQITGQVEVERGLLKQLRDLDPQDPDRRHSLGWFLHTHDRNCNSVEFDEAIADRNTDPAFRATYFAYKGDIRLDCGDPQAAIASYDKYVERASEEADPYEMRSQAYLMVGEYKKVRDDLIEARNLGSNTAILLKGQLERELGRFSDAERELNFYLTTPKLPPNAQRDGLLARGRLHLDGEQFTAAKDEALAALQLEGGYQVQAYWLLGLAELGLGRPDEAKKALAKLEEEYAASPSRYLEEYRYDLRAELAVAEGRFDDAQAELAKALDNEPGDRLYFMAARAAAFEKAGRPAEAFAAYLALLKINPNQPRALCAAAALADRLALLGEAARLYRGAQKFLDEQADDPRCQQCRARAEQLAGMPETIHE